MKKYYIRYVEDCMPVTKEFKTKKSMLLFEKKFRKQHPDPNSGWWIDLVFSGVVYYDDLYDFVGAEE